MSTARRYVVIGAGGVGVAIAAGLHDAGIPVVLVARGRSLEAIRAHGLRYTRPEGTRVLDLDVVAGPQDVTLGAGDVLVLATKTQDASGTLEQWAWQPLHDADGRPTGRVAAALPLVTTQNGLEAERLALRWFGTVVGGTTLVAARHVVPGEVTVANHPRVGQLFLGAAPASALSGTATSDATTVAEAVAADLDAAGWLVQVVPDVTRWKAWKLAHNVTNAVELLAGDPADVDGVRRAVVEEARAALTAAGYGFADPDTERAFDPSLAAVSEATGWQPGRQSTWQSFARGSTSEVDFLNGEVVLLGRLHGVPTPVSVALQHVLGASALAGEAPGTRDVAEVLALITGAALAPTTESRLATTPDVPSLTGAVAP